MKVKMAIVGTIVLLAVAGSLFAQSGTVITIGGSYWRGASEFETGMLDTKKETKASNLIGPYINIRFDKITLGGSWFFGTWDLSQESFKYKVKRSDLNLSLGYSLNNNLSIFGAYKILKLTSEYGSEVFDIPDDTQEFWNVPYFGGGLSLMYPFPNSPLFLFGSGA